MEFEFDSKTISSCHLNFLFGAGINGGAFPQLNNFDETLKAIKKQLHSVDDVGFEELFNRLNKNQKERVKNIFIKEFRKKHNDIDFNCDSILNLQSLFTTINEIVDKSENRNHSMKQVNIFTANYDTIVETILKRLGYLYNSVSASNFESHCRYFNMVGYDYLYRKYIPTYFVSKIHGDIDNPILPGLEKYENALEANKFEILFKMKEKLLRPYSILFVIGYSGHDDHINRIINDCIKGGLTVYWFKYTDSDIVPADFTNEVTIIENEKRIDTSKLCADLLKKSCLVE